MATHALPLKEVINQTLRCTGDYFGTGYIDGRTWTRAQVIIAINQALLEWSRRTGFLRKIDTVALTESTKTYTLPDDCLRLLRIGFYDDNACTWIAEPTSITARDLAYLAVTGELAATYFFLEYLAYNKFGWQPNVGADITAYLSYIRSHTYWDTENDDPEDAIPTWFHKDIKWGAAKILLAESKEAWRKEKKVYCERKWNAVINRMVVFRQFHGQDHGAFPA